MFYTFRQNNSGGSFHYDRKDGITTYVIIEAENSYKANKYAEYIGLYFDGCYNGQDCSCCGDRWYKVDDRDGTEVPMIYHQTLDEYLNDVAPSGIKKLIEQLHKSDDDVPDACIHFDNHTFKWIVPGWQNQVTDEPQHPTINLR